MGLLKRLLQEQKDGGLLRRAMTLKNYEPAPEGETAAAKKKERNPSAGRNSPTRKKT
jgi:hypothetical protein